MNRSTRKGLGAILAGVGMTTLLGVMSGTGVVRADVEPQPPLAGEDAPTEAEVIMKERCIWYIDGVASAITLTADDSEDDTVYDGDQYSLSTTLVDYVAWTSGNLTPSVDPDAHEACTFFGEQTGIDVDGVWSGTEFTADAIIDDVLTPDSDNMGFSADGTDPLTFGLTEGTCRAYGDWIVGESIVAIDPDELDMVYPSTILGLGADDATERPNDAAGSNDKCNAMVSVTASIPAGKTPLYAGKPYKFTGPSFTTEINIDSDRMP